MRSPHYAKYREACIAAGRTIPVHEYLCGLPSDERAAIAAAERFYQPTEDHMKEVTVSFDELVQHGIDSGAELHNGMPWSFTFHGLPVTHENDDLYLVGSNPIVRLERGGSITIPVQDDPPAVHEREHEPEPVGPVDEVLDPTSVRGPAEIPDFAKPEDFDASAKEVAPAPLDDSGSIEDIEEPAPVSATEVCRHLENAPDYVTLPESELPIGTEIVVEQKGHFLFKRPGLPTVNGNGRTIYGAMLDARIIQ